MAKKKRRSSGKNGGIISQTLVFLMAGAIIVSFLGVPTDPSVTGIWNKAKAKSDSVSVWVNNCIPSVLQGDFSNCKIQAATVQIPGGNGTTSGGAVPNGTTAGANVSNLKATLASIPVKAADHVDYNRDEWKHWISQPASSCSSWDTREQVLYNQAVKDSTLKLQDSKGNETTDVSKACKVVAGTWNEPYKGVVVTDPKKLDIDHVIPLGYAASHGGQGWSAEKKQQYANDLSFEGHLLAVDSSSNRKKSDKGPSQWMPTNSNYECAYATDWVTIAHNYGLFLEQADVDRLNQALNTCK